MVAASTIDTSFDGEFAVIGVVGGGLGASSGSVAQDIVEAEAAAAFTG